MKEYDVVIIGGGPAGLTAGIYATRAGARTLIIEKAAAGGKANLADVLENYMGADGVSGQELMMKSFEQAKKCGADFLYDEVKELDVDGKTVKTAGQTIKYRALVIAGGCYDRNTGIDAEKKYIGRGVSYCAVCDGMFFRNKTVVVAGGGNTAFKDALYLSNVAERVYLVHRRAAFRADKVLVDRAKSKENVEFVTDAVVTGIDGDDVLREITVRKTDGTEKKIKTDGLFVALGTIPETEYLKGRIALNDGGYIVTDERMRTDAEGIYAAGDVREKTLRQIVTASSDGAVAGEEAANFALSKI